MANGLANFMTIRLPCAHDPFNHGMEGVIDVRTPLEYSEDHIPGAINLPVLTNEERHNVGKEYSENSFEARKTGAALISNNISKILQTHFNDKPKSYSCLVYCWRGGQRSRSLALILSMIGFNVKYLAGGYKNYRKHVISALASVPARFTYKVIGGKTGCGKTLLLKLLQDAGHQVLDLEALANHRGSVLGVNYDDVTQPSTKMFESKTLQKLMCFDPVAPVWLEAEGKRIGSVQVPESLFENVKGRVTDVYDLQSPIDVRVKYLLNEYEYLINNPGQLKERLSRLSKFNAPLKRWYGLIDDGKFIEFVKDILEKHYDPLYGKSKDKSFIREENQSMKVIVEVEDISEKYMEAIVVPGICNSSETSGENLA